MMQPYQAADGRRSQFNMVLTDGLLDLLSTGLAATELLADSRFSDPESLWTHREAFGDALGARVAIKGSDRWLAIFTELAVLVNRVAVLEELASDPQILANELATPPPGPSTDLPLLSDHPVQATSVPRVGARRAPALGEHTDETLGELGYTSEAIEALRTTGAFGQDDAISDWRCHSWSLCLFR
ncbi:MAG: CoA transferase [Pseudomonadota bacterium]